MTVYEALQIIDVNKYVLFGSNAFKADMEAMNTEHDKKLYALIKDICSLHVEISNDSVKFQPSIILGKRRSFCVQDMTNNDFDLLESIDLSKLPVNIRARIADLLWHERKNYNASLVAIDAYIEMFNLLYSDDDWMESIDMIHRALCISAQVNQKEKHTEACKILYDHIMRINGLDDCFLSINLLEIIIREKYGEPNDLVYILDKIIQNSDSNVLKVKSAYALKVECFKWKNDNVNALNTKMELAQFYEKKANEIEINDSTSIIMVEQYLKDAAYIYRNIKKPDEAERLQKQLVKVQSKLPQTMKAVGQKYDVSALNNYIEDCFDGLTFQEALLRLSHFTVFRKKEDIKKEVINDAKKYVYSHLFKKIIINDSGQTILNLDPLPMQNFENNPDLLEKHMHRKLISLETIDGDLFLSCGIRILREKYDFQMSDLDYLIVDNGLIPDGREDIIKSALYMSLKGKEYEAIHILAPQLENIFRSLAKELGALTVTLENDGTSKEKTLTSVFDLPELVNSYDNDVLFMFKGLLNEQAGANIRNEVAHGLLNESSARSGACVFFFCAVIHLLSYTSLQCLEMYNCNSKLTHSEPPKKDIVPKPIKE